MGCYYANEEEGMKPCTQCGRCCTNSDFMGSLTASGDDVKRWRREGRDDILSWVQVLAGENNPFGDLWISPRTGNEAQRCPFVRKIRGQERYTCTIYETRPETCQQYPMAVDHMKTVRCEMLEPGDTDADVAAFMGRSE